MKIFLIFFILIISNSIFGQTQFEKIESKCAERALYEIKKYQDSIRKSNNLKIEGNIEEKSSIKTLSITEFVDSTEYYLISGVIVYNRLLKVTWFDTSLEPTISDADFRYKFESRVQKVLDDFFIKSMVVERLD